MLRRNIRPARADAFDYDVEFVRKALGVTPLRRFSVVAAGLAILLLAASVATLSQVPEGNPVWRVFNGSAEGTGRGGQPGGSASTIFTGPPVTPSITSPGVTPSITSGGVVGGCTSIQPREWHTAGPYLYGVAIDASGSLIATGGSDLKYWNLSTGTASNITPTGQSGTINSVQFSRDGRYLMTATYEDGVRLFEAATGRLLVGPIRAPDATVEAATFNADGTLIITGGYDKTVRLWSVPSGKAYGSALVGSPDVVTAVAASPDGSTIASGSQDGKVLLWNTTSQKLVASLTGHVGAVYTLVFSRDGRQLISAGADRTIQFWDVAKQTADGPPLTGHASTIYAPAVSPDGKTLASGDGGNVLRFWDIAGGRKPIGSPTTVNAAKGIEDIAFSPDGCTIALVSFAALVRVQSVPRPS